MVIHDNVINFLFMIHLIDLNYKLGF